MVLLILFMRVALTLLFSWALLLKGADLALVGGTIDAWPGARPITDAVVLIDDGHIAALGSRSSVKLPTDIRVIDCSGKFITAGFWNNHVHILAPGLLHVSSTKAAELDKQLDEMRNGWGFTTVFDVASVLENTLMLRHRVDSGEVRGPRILTVGEPLWAEPPSYVRGYLATNHIVMPVVATPAAAAARVRSQARSGADGIKLFAGTLQESGTTANMPLDMLPAAVGEAHRLGLPVFANPQNFAGLEASIASASTFSRTRHRIPRPGLPHLCRD